MISLNHSVRKETLSVRCDSTDSALALRGHLADLNSSRLLPVIDRVLAELAVEGRQIRIDRLEVKLGCVPIAELDTVVPARLYTGLKDALECAMRSPFAASEQSETASRMELLDWYLRRGALPWWAPPAASFSLDAWLTELAREAPAGLAALVRHAGAEDAVLERIVHQLDLRGLQRLIAVLDPEHAALILAYVLDLGELQREQVLVAVETAAFDRLVWLLVLAYLIRQAGSQFNRKMFLASLLKGFALHEGIGYDDILVLLGKSLERTLARHGFLSSLPSVIAELIDDAGLGRNPPIHAVEDRVKYVNDSDFPNSDPARLAQLVRRFGSDLNWLERLVGSLDEDKLVALIGMLEPEHAAAVVAFLFDVRDSHREEPVLVGDPRQFDRLLWTLAISYLCAESGSEFNRKAFLLSLVERLARAGNLTREGVLATLRLGLDKAAARAPLRSSLPGILASLLEDFGSDCDDPVQPAEPSCMRDLAIRLTQTPLEPDVISARLRVVLAAIRQMPVAAIRQLLSRILPSLDVPLNPLAEALQSAMEKISDPGVFYARLIAAVMNGQNLDFEQLLADTEEIEPLSRDLGQWDYSSIQSAIVVRLALGLAAPDGLTFPALVAALFRRNPQEARRFLKSLTRQAPAFNTLARSFASEEFRNLLDLIAGPGSRSLKLLLDACRELSPADRPSAEALRIALLKETVGWDPAHEMSHGFFARILRASFPAPFPERIRESLLAAIPEDASSLRASLSAHSFPEVRVSHALSTPEALSLELETLLDGQTDAAYSNIRAMLADLRNRNELRQSLPRAQMVRLVQLLEPGQAHILLRAAEILAAAWARTFPAMSSREIEGAIWVILLELLAEGSASVLTLTAQSLECVRRMNPSDSKAIAEFVRHSRRLAGEAGAVALREALESAPAPPDAQPSRPRPKAPGRPAALDRNQKDDALHIANAGLVLTSPYLPHLFLELDMLRTNEKRRHEWRDKHSASRAVHLLQYLADERTSAPEPLLALNKILCGLPTSAPVEKEIDLTATEKTLCEKLLQAMIANWKLISNTSAAGLQETFFQREGLLDRSEAAWKLQVQRKTVDVLVDQVPWSFSAIFHDWMPEPVHVAW